MKSYNRSDIYKEIEQLLNHLGMRWMNEERTSFLLSFRRWLFPFSKRNYLVNAYVDDALLSKEIICYFWVGNSHSNPTKSDPACWRFKRYGGIRIVFRNERIFSIQKVSNWRGYENNYPYYFDYTDLEDIESIEYLKERLSNFQVESIMVDNNYNPLLT
jgi:hypothetical protein